MATETEQGLAILYESDSNIESLITGTLRAHFSQWKKIGASTFALSVIQNGYIPKLGAMPRFYAEKNNKSYRDHADFANDAVMKLLGIGVVAEVSRNELRCINPLTVAQNSVKLRLCIDLSRCFNLQCDAQTFKIESTVQALASIDPNDFMFSFDLKSAYLQVPMNPSFWPFLGFAIQIPRHDGSVSERFFCYKMLPFGLNDAARVLTKLLKVPIKHWRAQGISVFVHLDDGFSFSNSKEQALQNSAIVRSDLQKLGLLISEEKCQWGARNVLEWTGFIWDTNHFRLFVTDKKIAKALALVTELSQTIGPVALRTVARLVGLLVSFYLAMGPISRFHSRGLMTFVASQVQNLGWNGSATLDTHSRIELSFWTENMLSLNGALMRNLGVTEGLDVRDLASDASNAMIGAAEFVGGVENVALRVQEPLQEDDLGESSTFRELRALELALQVRGESLRGKAVRWVSDSKSAVTILTVGSMKSRCHAIAVQIWRLAHSFDINLSSAWQPRDSPEIQVCDEISKSFDSSDYKLSSADFEFLQRKFGPFCLDLFASPSSYLFKPFCARYLCKDAVAVDAFSVDWGHLSNGFFHPPVGVVTKVLKQAQSTRAKGVLIVPVWTSADYWPVIIRLVQSSQLIELTRFRPFLLTAQWVKSETFKGTPKFDFVAYRFNF